mmetsp:Transcript_4449/g.5517  ORF Transcript_4449/g.5517 Transcript_4449/m.5517 type:complete len:183 (+) Transcript_4449:3-551(+)
MFLITLVTALFAQASASYEQQAANSSLIEDVEFPQHKAFENGIASSTYPTAFPTPPPTPMPTPNPTESQYCKTLDNGCPETMPNRYPANNRCFEKVWGGSMCNVDPANDPLSFQRNDKKCCSCFPALGGGQKLENGCPASIPFRYPNNNRCFAKMWEGYSCNVDPANDPLAFQRSDQKCCFD